MLPLGHQELPRCWTNSVGFVLLELSAMFHKWIMRVLFFPLAPGMLHLPACPHHPRAAPGSCLARFAPRVCEVRVVEHLRPRPWVLSSPLFTLPPSVTSLGRMALNTSRVLTTPKSTSAARTLNLASGYLLNVSVSSCGSLSSTHLASPTGPSCCPGLLSGRGAPSFHVSNAFARTTHVFRCPSPLALSSKQVQNLTIAQHLPSSPPWPLPATIVSL